MKLTRIIIPVLTFASATLLVAQGNLGQPEPFPAPGDPLPAPAVVPKPLPAPAVAPKPPPAPVVPNPIPAPIAICSTISEFISKQKLKYIYFY